MRYFDGDYITLLLFSEDWFGSQQIQQDIGHDKECQIDRIKVQIYKHKIKDQKSLINTVNFQWSTFQRPELDIYTRCGYATEGQSYLTLPSVRLAPAYLFFTDFFLLKWVKVYISKISYQLIWLFANCFCWKWVKI